MRRALITLLATVLAAGTLSLAASPASAAPSVRVSAPKPAVAPYLGTTTVKPRVTKSKGVKVVSTRITVKQGSRTVVRSRSSARLKAGSYRVTTVVKYRPSKKAKVRTKKATHRVTVRQGAKNCATAADLARVRTILDGTAGDTRAVVAKKLYSQGVYTETWTLEELRALFVLYGEGVPPELEAVIAERGADATLHVRDYRVCGRGQEPESFFFLTVDGVQHALF